MEFETLASNSTLRDHLGYLRSALDRGLEPTSEQIIKLTEKVFPLTDNEALSPLPVAELISDQAWFWDLLFEIACKEPIIWYRTLVKAMLVHAHPEGLVNISPGNPNSPNLASNLSEIAEAVKARHLGDYAAFIRITEHYAETRRRSQVSVVEELMLEARELAGSRGVLGSIENLFGFAPSRFINHLRRLYFQAGLIEADDFSRILHSGIAKLCNEDPSLNAVDLWQEIYSANPEYLQKIHLEFSRSIPSNQHSERWVGLREFFNISVDHPSLSEEIKNGIELTNWLEDAEVKEKLTYFANETDNSYYGGLCRFAQLSILRLMVKEWGGSREAFIYNVKAKAETFCPIHQTSPKLATDFVESFLVKSNLNPDRFMMNRLGTQRFLALARESKKFHISEKAWDFLTRKGTLPLLEWQISALTSWVVHGRQGILSAATGTGKSRLGIAAILEAFEDGLPIILLTHRLAIKGQWKKDELMSIFDSDIHGFKIKEEDRYFTIGRNVIELSSEDHYDEENPPRARPGIVLIALDQSLAARPHLLPTPEKPGLLVADEVHQFNDPTGWKILNGAFSRRLGMSATVSGLEDYGLLPKFGGVKIADYGLGKAIRDDVICKYNLVVIRVPYMPIRGWGGYMQKVELTKKAVQDGPIVTEEELLAAEEKVEELLRVLINSTTGIPYASDENFDEVLDRVILAKHPEFMTPAKQYLRLRSEYNRLARQFKSQLSVLELLQSRIREHGKTLVFSNTKAQGKEFHQELTNLGVTTTYIDSDTEQSGRNDAFRALERNLTRALVSPQILDEGVNIPSAQIGLFLGTGNGKYRQIIQRMGRVLRKKSDSGEALIIVAVGMNTREDPGLSGERNYPDSQFGIMKKFANRWKVVDYEDGFELDQVLDEFLEPKNSPQIP